MPPIRKINCGNELRFTDQKGIEYKFDFSDVPMGVIADKNPINKLEQHLNNNILPNITKGQYQMRVHVFSVSPLNLTVCAANIGETIPDNWWN